MQKSAQTALFILQRLGAQHMVEYLHVQRASVANPADPRNLWDPSESCVLNDASLVRMHQHSPHDRHSHPTPDGPHYHFIWEDADGVHMEVQPVGEVVRPQNSEPTLRIMDWPNTDSIMVRIAERASRKAAEDQGETFEPDDFPDESRVIAAIHAVAPSVRAELNRQIQQEGMPDIGLAELDKLQYEYADDVIAAIPETEFQSLVAIIDEIFEN